MADPEETAASEPDARPEAPIDEEMLLDHEYDGIREYDNPMPRWWVRIFWATFIFAVGYFTWYTVLGKGQSIHQAYAEQMRIAAAQEAKRAASETVSEKMLHSMMVKPGTVAKGKAVFDGHCVPCHGQHAQGIIGPDLTDGYWIHGKGTLLDIFNVVSHGVPAKGMPTWSRQLSPVQLREVVAYVGTLRNTNVPGKAPQGKLVGKK